MIFLDRETVGHARDVIEHDAREFRAPVVPFRLRRRHVALPVFGQELGPVEEEREQPVHHRRHTLPLRHHARRAIHALKQEHLHHLQALVERLREADDRPVHGADVVDAARLQTGEPVLRHRDHVLDHHPKDPPQRLVPAPRRLEPGIEPVDLGKALAHHRQLAQVVLGEEPGAQPVVQVVVVIGTIVGHRRHLRLGRGVGLELEIPLRVDLGQRIGQARAVRHLVRAALVGDHRPVMLGDALERLPGQVEPVEGGIVPLELGHDPQRLRIVVEAAILLHQHRKRILAGVAEGRMAEVMGQRHRLGQIGVQPERAGDRARHLRHLDGVRHPGAVIIALVLDEDLGLVLEPAEGRGMDDPVAVALERRAEGRDALRKQPPAAGLGMAGIGLQHGSRLVLPVRPSHPISGKLRKYRPPEGSAMLVPPKVTPRAFARLAEINGATDAPRALRIAVEGGGCSGFQYDMTLEEAATTDDLVLEGAGQRVLIDPVSLPFLENATIDFTDELIGARFVVVNPNATSSCGCGISFSM
ncbi:Iron-sulfur cluster insertion protein ErpA [bioreactor metagenome]|uniref:Iron-sulfur cluster insertion protein ErpA n=1 Tax=bioreactor metagenome TaxID=1076179 RepID=A0A644U3X9_9ZZZZ